MRMSNLLLALMLVCAAVAVEGGVEDILAGQQESDSFLGTIAKDWQMYTVLVMMLMVGVVALAYVMANAFSLPDLKAWADVELGEIFASALLLIFIMGIMLLIDVFIAGTIGPSFPKSCDADRGGFCAANIAADYLTSYETTMLKLHKTIITKSIDTARAATAGSTVGIQDLIYAYLTFRFRVGAQEMVTVEMYDQLIQNLGAIMGAVYAQSFLLDLLSLKLAPIAIFTGLIMRSFFLTRKLGGLLLAFGLGFIIIYPMCYALAWFTLDAAIYGAKTASNGPVMPCPEVCKQSNKIVDYISGTPMEADPAEVKEDIYNECIQQQEASGRDENGRLNSCMEECRNGMDEEGSNPVCLANCIEDIDDTGRRISCMDLCVADYTNLCQRRCDAFCESIGHVKPLGEMESPESRADWEECALPCYERDNCFLTNEQKVSYCQEHACHVLTGFDGDKEAYCRRMECRPPIGFTGDKETYCENSCPPLDCEITSAQIFADLGAGMDDAERVDIGTEHHIYGKCPIDPCGFPIPFHQKGCILYTERPNVCNVRYFDDTDPAYTFVDPSELTGCNESCRTLAPIKNCNNYKFVRNEDGEYENMPKCPSQCMWITASGITDETCPDACDEFYPPYHGYDTPQYLWDNKLANDTCVYIIPDVVFERPEDCSGCIFVAEKGLTMEPQIIMDCTALCGAATQAVMAEDPATMTNNIKGMIGPTELVGVSKLMIPAYVLPFFCLAVTLMFVMALSPMLGGDIDIPGMMRMIT